MSFNKIAGILVVLLVIVFAAELQGGYVTELVRSSEPGPAARDDDGRSAADEPRSTSEESAPAPEPEPEPESEPATEPEPAPEPESEAPTTAGPYDGGLPAIVRSVNRAVGGPRPRIYQVILSEEFAQISVEVPRVKGAVDTYTWRDGEVTGPEPERIPATTNVDEALFPMSDVDLDVIPGLVDRAAKLDGLGGTGEVSTTIIARPLPFDRAVRINVNVTGPRASKQLRATGRGRITEIV